MSAPTESVLALARDADRYAEFERQGRSCGWCSRPVQLGGGLAIADRATGELLEVRNPGSDAPPVLTRCGNRRRVACPSCSALYAGDSRHIVIEGLRSARAQVVIFFTATAPSHGAVHRSSADPCPTAEGACHHQARRSCETTHDPASAIVGTAVCSSCYRYRDAVRWNASAPDLWRRTTIGFRRSLAAVRGLPQAESNASVRLSFVKVAEFQARGSVHFHGLVRATAQSAATPVPIEASDLAEAVDDAFETARYPLPDGSAVIRWGRQLDVAPVDASDDEHGRRLANYLAKYVTKSATDDPVLGRPILDRGDPRLGAISEHHRRLVEECLRDPALRRSSNTFGFGGHVLTKSRDWSVTFGHLRDRRREWAKSGSDVRVVGELTPIGFGWETSGEQFLARHRARGAIESRRAAREDR